MRGRITVKASRREWADRLRAYGPLAELAGARSILRTREVRYEYPSFIYYGSQAEFDKRAARVRA